VKNVFGIDFGLVGEILPNLPSNCLRLLFLSRFPNLDALTQCDHEVFLEIVKNRLCLLGLSILGLFLAFFKNIC
jgi:hypothetical protein